MTSSHFRCTSLLISLFKKFLAYLRNKYYTFLINKINYLRFEQSIALPILKVLFQNLGISSRIGGFFGSSKTTVLIPLLVELVLRLKVNKLNNKPKTKLFSYLHQWHF